MLCALVAASPAAPADSKAAPWLPALKPDDDVSCDATVAYLFMAPEANLPLAPVWRKYFDSCPSGSYTVHVHRV